MQSVQPNNNYTITKQQLEHTDAKANWITIFDLYTRTLQKRKKRSVTTIQSELKHLLAAIKASRTSCISQQLVSIS